MSCNDDEPDTHNFRFASKLDVGRLKWLFDRANKVERVALIAQQSVAINHSESYPTISPFDWRDFLPVRKNEGGRWQYPFRSHFSGFGRGIYRLKLGSWLRQWHINSVWRQKPNPIPGSRPSPGLFKSGGPGERLIASDATMGCCPSLYVNMHEYDKGWEKALFNLLGLLIFGISQHQPQIDSFSRHKCHRKLGLTIFIVSLN